LHLYVHIPFCHRICPYCSFYKHTPGNTDMRGFIDALIAEARQRAPQLLEPVTTLYLGGGTPSMLSRSHLSRLFDGLHSALNLRSLGEVTLEANPATFDAAKAQHFLTLGVNRVSLGIQSFAPHVLQTLGREHSREEATTSVEVLRDAGMPAINIDLMFSIPGQSAEDWQETIQTAASLAPDHISAYNLTYEEDTEFLDRLTRGEYREDIERNASDFLTAERILTAAGFDHYETSNYAKPGFASVHNQGYWRGHDYLGLGPSAVSTLNAVRHRNLADTPGYITMINHVGHAATEVEELDAEARRIERLALLLRTREGAPLSLLDAAGRDRLQILAEELLVTVDGERLRLIGRGPLLVDEIAAHLV
jgi:oxygen-independent coproporphyrinogen-3 oxidase